MVLGTGATSEQAEIEGRRGVWRRRAQGVPAASRLPAAAESAREDGSGSSEREEGEEGRGGEVTP